MGATARALHRKHSRTPKCVSPIRKVGSIHYNRINTFRVERAQEKAERSEALGNKKLALSKPNTRWEQSASNKGLDVLASIRPFISDEIKTKCCGYVGKGERVAIQASTAGEVRVHTGNTCKSSMCPVCAPKKDAKRAQEVELLLNRWKREGWWVSFGTATLSHSVRCSIQAVGDDFKEAWFKARLNTKNAVKKGLGIEIGIEYSLDWTYGRHGFHPHAHFLVMTKQELTPAQASFIQNTWKDKWRASVGKLGRKVNKRAGMKFVEVDLTEDNGEFLASYLSKTSKVSYEVVGSSTKEAAPGNWTISDIWKEMALGNKKAIAIFHQIARWLKGKQVFNRCAFLTKLMKEERGAIQEEEKAELKDVFLLGSGAQRQVEKRRLYKPLMRLAHRLMTSEGQFAMEDAAFVKALLDTWNKGAEEANDEELGRLLEQRLRTWR